MKLSAVYAITVVLLVFLTVQGWVLKNRVWSPSAVNVVEAVLLGRTADVRTPETVQITDILVQEGDRVEAGDVIFRVRGDGPFSLTATQDGVVTGIATTPGSFAQGNETLARIVDTSADSLFVLATLGVNPEHVGKVRPGMLATIQADHMNGGEPIDVVLTSVSPEYDSEGKTVEARFKLVDVPADLSSLLTGLPVELSFKKTSSGSLWDRVAGLFGSENDGTATATGSVIPSR